MKNDVEPDFLSQLEAIFAQLNPQAVEEFYAAYRQWSLQQRITELRQRIDAVRAQQGDNEQRLRETQPSAIALAALARLQSNGVSDIALLDAMLERGESWLDQTMQRLDYFEQFDDFISDDYTKWCQGALEGAFDWIDSLRDAAEQEAPVQLEATPEEILVDSEDAGDVEALLLQKLATEDEEDDLAWQEATTLKRTAIQLPSEESAPAAPAEEQELANYEEATPPETALQATEYIPPDESVTGDEIPIDSSVGSSSSIEEQIIPEEVLPVEDTVKSEAEAEQTVPADTITPEDIPTPEYAARGEASKPGEIGNSASEKASQGEQQAIAPGKPITPARSTPPKGGLIRHLIWILTGK
jgi:hypothetical protein